MTGAITTIKATKALAPASDPFAATSNPLVNSWEIIGETIVSECLAELSSKLQTPDY